MTTTSPGSPTFSAIFRRGVKQGFCCFSFVAASEGGRSVDAAQVQKGLRPILTSLFRLRKRRVSAQEPHRAIQSVSGHTQDIGGGGGVLQHHQFRENVDESRWSPLHDWLGPISVKPLHC